jgi:alkanesulfonate monooxygenase SsuD/methylene tetrahydromethanopterin reductase-like flavin-dependent oxidoreductase (luciferase family)
VRIGLAVEPRLPGSAEFARSAEQLGVDSLWVPEVWGYDAVTEALAVPSKCETLPNSADNYAPQVPCDEQCVGPL